MRIAVVGAGAMGALFGGSLTEAGYDVVLVDVPGPHLQAMQSAGLRLHTDAGARVVSVQAGTAEAFAGARDLLIVFTKGPHTGAALRAAAHLAGPDTRVLTVQNGLGNAERIAAALPGIRVLVGVTNWPSDLHGPGHVSSHGHGSVRIWTADGQADPVVRQVSDALSSAGLNCEADPAVGVAIWEKVAFNAGFNSVCAATRLAVGGIADSPDGRALVLAVAMETLAVARARGVAVDDARVRAMAEGAFTGHRGHKPSMLQDVLAGRQTEIDSINGAVVEAGEASGVPTPVTRVLRDIVRLIDLGRGSGDPEPSASTGQPQ